jgi:hypothetical protein
MIDKPGVRFDATYLRLIHHEDFRSFFKCDGCNGRRVERSILVTRQGLEKIGKWSLDPELELADELFDRLKRKADISDISSPKTRVKLQRAAPSLLNQCRNDDIRFLGFVLDKITLLADGRRRLWMGSDCMGDYYFTLSSHLDRLRVVDVRIKPPEDLPQ